MTLAAVGTSRYSVQRYLPSNWHHVSRTDETKKPEKEKNTKEVVKHQEQHHNKK